jgi:translation initiation factor IF-2
MAIRHFIQTAIVAVALVLATPADAKGPRGKGKPAAKPAAAAPAPTPGARPGAGAAARPGTPGATIPGQGPRPGMMHVKPGNNPNAHVTFNVPAAQGSAGAPRTGTTAGSATTVRPAPRTTAGSATTVRPNTAQAGSSGTQAPASAQPPRHAFTPVGSGGAARNTQRDAGGWRPVAPAATGASGAATPRAAPRNTSRDAGNWSAVNPAPAAGALKPPAPAHAPVRKDARPAGETRRTVAPQPNIQRLKSSKNAQGDGRVSTMGQGPKPAPDNARQLADFMMIESTLRQQRAPKTPEE